MKRNLFLIAASAVMLTTSCGNEPLDSSSADARYSVSSTITLQDVWKSASQAPQRRNAMGAPRPASELLFQTYIFDSADKAVYNLGGYMNDTNRDKRYQKEFKNIITTPGTYKFYSILNVASGEYTTATSSMTSENTFTLSTTYDPNDVCLGTNTLTVTASVFSYTVDVTVNHIMSKLALQINSVPSDISSLSVDLPSQSNTFDFTGKFTGNTTSQTLTLTKAAEANEDGTYDWTCPSTIVFPCATGTTSMPITIHWASASASKDINTASTTCCLSGKNLKLETTWSEKFSSTSTVTINPWSEQEDGTFPWN